MGLSTTQADQILSQPLTMLQKYSWTTFCSSILLLVVSKAIYNIWLHPLSKYPGPRSWAMSSIPIAQAQLRGNAHSQIKDLHDRYGSVVRIAPNELSFTSASAWSDIYARSRGQPPLARDRTFFNDMLVDPQTITMADDENHARLRRSMAPAFSPRALRDQESIIQANVNLLVNQLQARSYKGLPIDLRDWYNFTTFDLIGDLAFGESFGSLESSKTHAWVGFILQHFYTSTLLHVAHRFKPLQRVLAWLIPKSVMEQRASHDQLTHAKIQKRLNMDPARSDFTSSLLEAAAKGRITSNEVEKQASILILAGSETTSVALTFATYLLTQHRRVRERLEQEIFTSFQDEGEINILNIHKLDYLQAVLQETLRLFPPITNGFPRQVSRQDTVVDGLVVPRKVVVNVNHWAAYRSERNFALADQFLPERWLGDDRFEQDARESFQPFSVGPRNCIGRQFAYDTMKLVLTKMLWRFKISLADESIGWIENQRAYVSLHQPPLMVKLDVRQL